MRRPVSAAAAPPAAEARGRRSSLALAWPFGAVALIGLLSVCVPPYERAWWVTGAAGVCLAAVVATFLLARREGAPTWLSPLSAYLMFPFAGLVHDAAGASLGGSSSGMTVLLLVPILWLAITGTARQLQVASVLAVLTFVVPIVVIGPPDYSVGDWRRALVWAAVALVIAPVVQRLVGDLDRETHRATTAGGHVERLFDQAPTGRRCSTRRGSSPGSTRRWPPWSA